MLLSRILLVRRKNIEVHFGATPPVLWPKPWQEVAVLSSGGLKFALRLTGERGEGVTLREVLRISNGSAGLIDCELPASSRQAIDTFPKWRNATWYDTEEDILLASDQLLVGCAVLQLFGEKPYRGVILDYTAGDSYPFQVQYEVLGPCMYVLELQYTTRLGVLPFDSADLLPPPPLQDGDVWSHTRSQVTSIILLRGEYHDIVALSRVLDERQLLPSTLCCWFGFDSLPLFPLVTFPQHAVEVVDSVRACVATSANLRRLHLQNHHAGVDTV